MGEWQDYVRSKAEALGLDVSSGYRTPEDQRRLGSSPTSYHTRGTREHPGALDIAGSADKLKHLFDEVKAMFQGRINELFLNLPSGTSEAIKNNAALGRNPEAGRPQHLHIAINGVAPAYGIPAENRGEKALAAAPDANVCARSVCPPDVRGWIDGALGREVKPQTNCLCWSDVWMYGTALTLILGGSWMLFLSRKE